MYPTVVAVELLELVGLLLLISSKFPAWLKSYWYGF